MSVTPVCGAAAACPTRRPVRVLIVDDRPAFRDVVAQTLSGDEGFEVVGSLPGTQNLAAEVDRLDPDLVLLDVRMPGDDGACAALHLRRARPDLTVVLMSVFAVEDVPAEVLRAGVGFLPKEELGPASLALLHHRSHRPPG